jgi:hypothetical protein
MELALRIGEVIRRAGGNVVSVLPPPAGGNIDFECPPHASEAIVTMLRDNGRRIVPRGTVRRLVPNATSETLHITLEDGTKTTRTTVHAGEVNLDAFELVLPSDADMASRRIPRGPTPPRKHRLPAANNSGRAVAPSNRDCTAGAGVCRPGASMRRAD